MKVSDTKPTFPGIGALIWFIAHYSSNSADNTKSDGTKSNYFAMIDALKCSESSYSGHVPPKTQISVLKWFLSNFSVVTEKSDIHSPVAFKTFHLCAEWHLGCQISRTLWGIKSCPSWSISPRVTLGWYIPSPWVKIKVYFSSKMVNLTWEIELPSHDFSSHKSWIFFQFISVPHNMRAFGARPTHAP